MLRFTIRDGLWLIALLVLAAAWWLDRSMLAINLANCRFVLEHQRETINALGKPADAP